MKEKDTINFWFLLFLLFFFYSLGYNGRKKEEIPPCNEKYKIGDTIDKCFIEQD